PERAPGWNGCSIALGSRASPQDRGRGGRGHQLEWVLDCLGIERARSGLFAMSSMPCWNGCSIALGSRVLVDQVLHVRQEIVGIGARLPWDRGCEGGANVKPGVRCWNGCSIALGSRGQLAGDNSRHGAIVGMGARLPW